MKKFSIILIGFLIFFTTVTLQANSESKDYFVGKWNLLVEGTPNGDAEIIMTLERKDGKLEGFLKGDDDEETKISRVEENEESITIYWFSQGYDVYMNLKKTDKDKLKGMLMDMFNASGERLVE